MIWGRAYVATAEIKYTQMQCTWIIPNHPLPPQEVGKLFITRSKSLVLKRLGTAVLGEATSYWGGGLSSWRLRKSTGCPGWASGWWRGHTEMVSVHLGVVCKQRELMVESSRNILIPGDSENPLSQHWTSHQVWWEKGNIGRFGFWFFWLFEAMLVWVWVWHWENLVFFHELMCPVKLTAPPIQKRRSNPEKDGTELAGCWSWCFCGAFSFKTFSPNLCFFFPILRYDWQIKNCFRSCGCTVL